MSSYQSQTDKVYLEVTNICNFGCDFCPSLGSRRKRHHMDFALFQKGIDDIARDKIASRVGFHILGEPLLYPRLLDALCYARRSGLKTEINTNGSLLTEDKVGQLAAAGLDMLAVSVQMIGEREHECRGSSVPFNQYYQRVLQATQLLQSNGTDVVLCLMDTSTKKYFDIDKLMRLNGKRDAFRAELARFALDVYAAINKPAPPADVETALSRLNLTRPQFVQLDEHVKVYVQPFADWGNAFTSKHVHPASLGFCGYALTNVGILNNGEVTICCADYDGHTSLGNIRTQSLASLLSSEKAQAIRTGFQKIKIVHPYCQRCIGSTNKLKALFKGLASVYLFKLLDFQPARVREVALNI